MKVVHEHKIELDMNQNAIESLSEKIVRPTAISVIITATIVALGSIASAFINSMANKER